MGKKQTVGERLMARHVGVDVESIRRLVFWENEKRIARRIDAAIRRAVKEGRRQERAYLVDKLSDMGQSALAGKLLTKCDRL